MSLTDNNAFVAGYQQVADIRLDPLHTLLGWARAQIPLAILPPLVRPERITEEFEAFVSGISDRSSGLVQAGRDCIKERLHWGFAKAPAALMWELRAKLGDGMRE